MDGDRVSLSRSGSMGGFGRVRGGFKPGQGLRHGFAPLFPSSPKRYLIRISIFDVIPKPSAWCQAFQQNMPYSSTGIAPASLSGRKSLTTRLG